MSVEPENDEVFVVPCECSDVAHMLTFWYQDYWQDEPPSLWLDIHLNMYHGIFKRIWLAIKYVLGYRCKFGMFDCWELSGANHLHYAVKLRDVLDKLIGESSRRSPCTTSNKGGGSITDLKQGNQIVGKNYTENTEGQP